MPALTPYTAQSTQVLGFNMLRDLVHRGGNLCISPISISLCLQLALYGARGNTAAQILRAAGLSAPDRASLSADAKALTEYLSAPDQHSKFQGPGAVLKLSLANSIWMHYTARLNGEYYEDIQRIYSAACASLDFDDPASIKAINSWVDKSTEYKIPRIIDQLSSANMLVLINCAYFKARWNQQFKRSESAPRDFHLENGSVINVPTMHMERTSMHYYKDEAVEVGRLDYTDSRFGMYLIMPAIGTDMTDFIMSITPERWQWWLSNLRSHSGKFTIPKFKLEFGIMLNDVLQRLGMVDAFTPQADFSNILAPDQEKPPLFCIQSVVHKTYISIDEDGTEAAAATAMMMYGSAMSPAPPPPFQMIIDRPFLYAIREYSTGTILFQGIVFDPR